MKKMIALLLVLVMAIGLLACSYPAPPAPGPDPDGPSDDVPGPGPDQEPEHEKTISERAAEMAAAMTVREKLAQMMIVAFRADANYTKDGDNLPDAYAAFLKKYDFGGILLFQNNIVSVEQTVSMIRGCQNAAESSDRGIPMLVCVDQEGGLVNRVTFGVTGPGSMALAAAGDFGMTEECADMLGQEISALGFNMDFAPVADINSNPANPVIGVRSFSDDPVLAAEHVRAFLRGLNRNGVSGALKHFPGHGNVGEDSHTHLPLSNLTLEELKACELMPFRAGVESGADMIMTAHIQYPGIEKRTYTSKLDGKKVCLPATLSRTIITDVLRGDLHYDGIVISDSMVMNAITSHFDETDAAVLAINAGVDILLCPFNVIRDRNTDTFPEAEAYMEKLVKRVEAGDIAVEELDDSVARILKLKMRKGIISDEPKESAGEQIARAEAVVGSAEHHARDWEMAERGLTLLKNESHTLPLDGNGEDVLILIPGESRKGTVEYALKRLEREGLLDAARASVMNWRELELKDEEEEDGKKPEEEPKEDPEEKTPDEQFLEALEKAKKVLILSQDTDRSELLVKVIRRVHENGGKAALLSLDLPYDAACYPEADAILCAYQAYGSARDEEGRGPFNLNVAAAVCAAFGRSVPQGTLPVNVPERKSGSAYSDEILYPRGFGIRYWGKYYD